MILRWYFIVSQNELVVKLTVAFGITGNSWKWFVGYLFIQNTLLANHQLSDPLPVVSGVLHGR